ncbi:MAG TPA: quinolinate synthase NadA [Candidatus Acidoferrales bacterium]|nr:quinolinate synthase NadA [Candidatus Acidoferrales bacterium]
MNMHTGALTPHPAALGKSERDALEPIYARMRHVVPAVEWAVHAPYVAAINELKRERNAVVLAHNYQTPEIFYGIADYTGDSLGLAQQAAATEAEVIVQCGVHFMAETSKVLSPHKTVLIPDTEAGCSLADAITPADIALLRQRYPGVPVVTYVNTSAAVKAASDICCTSANALEIVESLGTDKVIFLPDQYLGRWVASKTRVEIILWHGACEVHERFTGAQLREYRQRHAGIHIIAHPECPPDVLEEADYVGSTTGMVRHIKESGASRVVMVTECSMSDNVAVQFPQVEFIRPCNLCPHMKRITLPKVLHALQTLSPAVEVDAEIAIGARRAVERMLAVGRGQEHGLAALQRRVAAGR